MKEKILSISVAAYNIEKYIEQNLQSFINENILDDIEVIITDDGSKDNTPNIVEKYVNQYPNSIKLIKQKNAGPGSTVNSGIKNATGKYFKMVDGDDWVYTSNLEKFIHILKNTNVDVVFNNYDIYNDNENKITECMKLPIESGRTLNFDEICNEIKPKMHNVTIKTSILKENNIKLDNGFYTDVEYLLLPVPYINSIIYLDYSIYIYRMGQAEQSVSIPNMQKNINMHKIVCDRMINFYMQNKKILSNKKLEYLEKQIATVLDAHLGTLLTYDVNKENKKKIIKFNKELKNNSYDLYKKYKKGKKVKILIYSNYLLYKKLSKKYIKKLTNIF